MTPVARPGAPRDLTPEEWRALEARRRRRWPVNLAVGGVLLSVCIYLGSSLVGGRGSTGALNGVVGGVVGAALGIVGVLAVAEPFWPRAERPGGRPRRVGYHRGLVNVVGKPAKLTVGGIWVDVPAGWPLGLMEDVEVEITPPLEDHPNRRTLRAVVSAFGGRLRITDPSAPRTTIR